MAKIWAFVNIFLCKLNSLLQEKICLVQETESFVLTVHAARFSEIQKTF